MDALKSAGRAIIRSPSLAKQSWGGSKHRKLFFCFSFEIFLQFNSGRKGNKNLLIYASPTRISYCTADKMHDKVFAYIAQSQHNETLECHAFLAQAVTLTVAQAFRVAFEFWQVNGLELRKLCSGGGCDSRLLADYQHIYRTKDADGEVRSDLRWNGSTSFFVGSGNSSVKANNSMVSLIKKNKMSLFFQEIDDGLDEAFSRLAESRTNPQVLDIGVNPQDFQTECLSPTDWDKADMGTSDRDDIFSF
uniref:Low density lipoprotein receptor adaptor protein 1a n=1 Tax=Erpetoichthys calabaricus TaxID=27687 RepID=A0A8C4SVM2_ERPCA